MESSTLGGVVREIARDQTDPAVREARASGFRGSVLMVTCRSLTGDALPLATRGWAPRWDPGTSAHIVPVLGDRVWISQDEGEGLVVVAWEPAG